MRIDLLLVVALGVVVWAAVDAFGTLHGLGVASAVYLLMPHYPSKPRTP